MANRTVTLMRYCKTPDGWRRYAAVIGGNSRVKPGFVLVRGKAVCYPEGHYEVRFYEGSKVRYRNVGENAAEAKAECDKMARLLVAKDSAKAAGAVIVEETGRVILSKALSRFVLAAEDRGSSVAAAKYRAAGVDFLEVVGKRYADEVDTEDLLKFQRTLRKRGASDRTIFNSHSNVASFLRFAKVAAGVIPARAPKYEKRLPEAYTPEEMAAFFASLDSLSLTVTFSLALECGLREQELMHVQWVDVNLKMRTLLVRSKPDWGFNIKDKEERLLPLPKGVASALESFQATNGDRLFVTGTAGDKPNTHLLRTLKRHVRAAGLHCGACVPCVERGECEKWFLHKFRSTYATTLLRNGLDVRSVQKLMGHSDLESTMRYLRPMEDAELQAKVNSIVWR